jgi:hypothetical protein
MKRLGEFIFYDSSSSEEKDDDDEFEMVMTVILEDKICWPRLGSHLAICTSTGGPHQDHDGSLQPQPQCNVYGELFSPAISDAQGSLPYYCKYHGEA